MKFTVIIPARYASQRLPAKPLSDINGKTMIQHVYEQACKSQAQHVVVATDHPEIERVVQAFGGNVVMTREDHESGTDRLAQVAEILDLADDDIVVNVQGDEPLIPPEVINQVAQNLHENTHASIATVSEPIKSVDAYLDPNSVKVVADNNNMALYFSRAPIPWHRDLLADKASSQAALAKFLLSGQAAQKHIGIYAYRVSLLREFVSWPVAQIESIEKLEQLRAMAFGHRIHVCEACADVPGGVDTQQDLEKVRLLVSELNNAN